MDRAFSSGASGTPPSAPGSPSTGYATSGNPGTGTPATKPGAYWYHMVTEELRALIVAAGLTPDHTNTSQIAQAVQALIAAGAANDYKASVRAATTANIASLAGGAPNTLDGVTLAANDRILVKDQTTGSQNGIYVVTTLGTGANGTWSRASDADQAGELTPGAVVMVEEGTTLADSLWAVTTDGTITIGTTVLTFVRKDTVAATGFRNKIINGGMAVDQRNAGAAQTFTAAAALAYCADRWYGYCTGANVNGQRVAGSGANQYRYQFSGAASVTGIGFGQRIEKLNSIDLAGSTATLSVDLANSLLTTVTWTAYYANTDDTFGTLASPTRTQIATGSFTVNSTVTRYNAQIAIPAGATTGIEVVFSVGAQTSGTWVIGNVQLESGSSATAFERRPIGAELALCQRYFEKSFDQLTAPANGPNGTSFVASPVSVLSQGNIISNSYRFAVVKRAAATLTPYGNSSGQLAVASTGAAVTWTTVAGNISFGTIVDSGFQCNSSTTAFQHISFHFTASAEL